MFIGLTWVSKHSRGIFNSYYEKKKIRITHALYTYDMNILALYHYLPHTRNNKTTHIFRELAVELYK